MREKVPGKPLSDEDLKKLRRGRLWDSSKPLEEPVNRGGPIEKGKSLSEIEGEPSDDEQNHEHLEKDET